MKKPIRATVCLALLATGVFPFLAGCGKAPETEVPEPLVIASYGGAYQESQRKAIFDAFEAQRGIEIRDVTYSGEYAKIAAMVETGNYEWDVVDVESPLLFRGAKEGILEKIDYDVVQKDELYPWAANDFGVANIVYSNVIAYSLYAFPEGTPHPTSWQEFWDVERFPGKRALRDNPVVTLEAALLADGVAPEDLYPLDVDRAFRSLDRIKPHVQVWWESGDQPPQLLAAGEVALSSAYNGRIWAASHRDNLPVAEEWGQGIMDSDWWIVPRDLPKDRRRLAMEFIAFAIQARLQADQTRYVPYGPTNTAALAAVDAESRLHLPTAPENLAQQLRLDPQWWAENEAAVLDRWNRWRRE